MQKDFLESDEINRLKREREKAITLVIIGIVFIIIGIMELVLFAKITTIWW